MKTKDLTPSGTIKQSEVIAEFGKGNNLLDYLGEGGVTGSAPLKLTDFYGTSAAPPAPPIDNINPIHTYGGMTLNKPGGAGVGKETGVVINWVAAPGDLVALSQGYFYGRNSDAGYNGFETSVSPGWEYNSPETTRGHREIFEKPPVRYSFSATLKHAVSPVQYTYAKGSYDSVAYPVNWIGHGFVIPRDKLPWPDGSTVTQLKGGGTTTVSDAVPNSGIVLVQLGLNYDGTNISLSNVQGQWHGLGTSRKYGGNVAGYKVYQADASGKCTMTVTGNIPNMFMGVFAFYVKNVRRASGELEEGQVFHVEHESQLEPEEVIETGPVVPTPPWEEE